MTNLLEIKPYIKNFVEENLALIFANKVYWIGERVNVPTYPYCVLSVVSENKDKRTSTHVGKLNIIGHSGYSSESGYGEYREAITTLYKTATITVSIYNAYIENTYDDVSMDIAKETAYEQINILEELFETRRVQEDFYPIFSIQRISPIRPLHEVVDGGYMYRYEFDLTVGYDEPYIENMDIGKQVEVEMDDETENDQRKIWFEVDGETGQINNLI